MIKTNEELYKYLNNTLLNELSNKAFLTKVTQLAFQKYNYPPNLSSDYFTLKVPFEKANQQELFILVDTIGTVKENDTVHFFYSDEEIKLFSEDKYHQEKITFPLKYQCIQISEQQWIGKISAKELMRLRDAQLIKYNEKSQRTMKHIVRGDSEIWKISLNKKAVDQIVELMQQGRFIPNTITLNMPQDAKCEYNQDKQELKITTDHFDILDGYHRFIALSKASNLDPDFDYVMEIRFTQYPPGQDEYFTYQEDQKTHMTKMQSKALDPSDLGNQICKTLNADFEFLLNNQLLRSGGIIDMSVMSETIRFVYLDNPIPQKDLVKTRLSITNELKTKLNQMISKDLTLTEKNWSPIFIVSCIVCCRELDSVTSKDVYDLIEKTKEKGIQIRPTQLRKKAINNMRKCIS